MRPRCLLNHAQNFRCSHVKHLLTHFWTAMTAANAIIAAAVALLQWHQLQCHECARMCVASTITCMRVASLNMLQDNWGPLLQIQHLQFLVATGGNTIGDGNSTGVSTIGGVEVYTSSLNLASEPEKLCVEQLQISGGDGSVGSNVGQVGDISCGVDGHGMRSSDIQ